MFYIVNEEGKTARIRGPAENLDRDGLHRKLNTVKMDDRYDLSDYQIHRDDCGGARLATTVWEELHYATVEEPSFLKRPLTEKGE